jgi:hypothetical protein
VGCACVRVMAGRGVRRSVALADAGLLLLFWPLYAPFLLITGGPPVAPRPGPSHDAAQRRIRASRELDGMVRALDRLRGQTDPETWGELRARLDVLMELFDE